MSHSLLLIIIVVISSLSLLDNLITHNITISLDRQKHYYLYHHSFVPSAREYFGSMHFYQTVDRLTRQTVMVGME